ncbi:MAG: 2'-5' RNA ligase family protein [Pseudonocardiales bacterium]|nr:2'-5' RNA ligase family protein [Pseudonocardiales bacterium]
MSDSTDMMRNHWWWRPGWRLGRSFYTWHITFLQNSQLVDFSARHKQIIDKFETLDQVPVSGLHITLQGIGFVDEVARADIDHIVAVTRARCSRLRDFEIEIGPTVVDAEGVYAPVHPIETVTELRKALRGGIGDTWGEENVPESIEGFRPHLTFAYSNGVGSIRDVEAALKASDPGTVRTEISTVSLINLNRDRRLYEWSQVATVRVGQ